MGKEKEELGPPPGQCCKATLPLRASESGAERSGQRLPSSTGSLITASLRTTVAEVRFSGCQHME